MPRKVIATFKNARDASDMIRALRRAEGVDSHDFSYVHFENGRIFLMEPTDQVDKFVIVMDVA